MHSQKPLLIHIGYPKTASSWLQKGILKDETLGFLAPWGAPSGEAIAQFVIPNTFRFSTESVRRVFEPGLEEAARRNLVPVLSHEHLAGNQIRGRYHAKEVADRIHAVFPEARILVFIREQQSMILSSYRQYIKGAGTAPIQRFLGLDIKKRGFEPICRLDYLEYDLLIKYYQNLFGLMNILVVPFELLKMKQEKLIYKKIVNFLEIEETEINSWSMPINVGYGGATLPLKRQMNRFVMPNIAGSELPLSWRIVNKLTAGIDRVIPNGIHQRVDDNMKIFIREFVGDYFKDSNQRTSQLIGMNLADFGYDC